MNKLYCVFYLWFFLFSSVFAEDNFVGALNKLGYGVTTKGLEEITKAGYEGWISNQMYEAFPDRAIDEKYKFERGLDGVFNLYKRNELVFDESSKQAMIYGSDGMVQKNLKRRLGYALESEAQIRERLVWFWYNHFNIGVYVNYTSAFFLNDFEDKIRAKSLGNFKNLLKMVVHHPSMLKYLNNNENSKFNLNENYARELLELHTVGVNAGYSQDDILNLAKLLTGHTVIDFEKFKSDVVFSAEDSKDYESFLKSLKRVFSEDSVIDGFYIFDAYNHDFGEKSIFGYYSKGSGYNELDDFVDFISLHPATAKFISKKLAVYFLNDTPSDVVVDSMADTFLRTNGDIRAVLETLFFSDEFRGVLGKNEKVKDAYTYFVSTARILFDEKPVTDEIINNFANILTYIEADPYFKTTPDGFSIYGKDWVSSSRIQEYMFITKFMLLNKDFTGIENFSVNYDLLSFAAKKRVDEKRDVFMFLTSDDWFKK